MERDATKFMSSAAEQHCADLAAASIREDNGKHINQPWVIGAALQALAPCDREGYAAWCHPWFHSYASPLRSSKNHPQNHPLWFTYKENKHDKRAQKGKCGFFFSLSFDWILESCVLLTGMIWAGSWQTEPSFPPLLLWLQTQAMLEKRRC